MSFKSFLRDNKEAVDVNISEPTNVKELSDFIDKEKLETIVVSTEFGDKNIHNIDFLKKIANKQSIKEIHIMNMVEDYSLVYEFGNLCKLTLCYQEQIATKLDLSMLPALEYLALNGNFEVLSLEKSHLKKLMINESNTFEFISKCETLENLEVIRTPSFGLKQFKFFPNLKKLILTQSKASSLKDIGSLPLLEDVSINYCSQLTDISEVSKCTKLRKLEFCANKKISNFECLSTLKNLVGLVISNCGSIPSLKFIKGMAGLKFLSFVDTNIVDGDLTECLRLECVGTKDKNHYNVLSKNLPNNKDFSFWKL